MARYGQRPENALKRANEFIQVGKSARALDTLQEVFRNKKWTYNWSESVLEPIMFKYLELCVELKKSHIAKEGLFQYRNMFQSVNVGSLENVIRGYLFMAEEKTEAARKQSQQAVIDIDDLDNLATPEGLLLSAVSGEDAQDRSDRTILTPWVKFLWESYCQCLELLRTNAHVETLYHDIARMAFQFCLEYNRKTEFRKLCEKLRKHLEDICKLPQLVSNVSINKVETQQLNLETRLTQLDSAIQMELWQEAYKAIEDIHGLMNLSRKMSVPKTMANYYLKLALVFWKAGNYLFHAAALFKLLQLLRDMKKNMSSEEQQRMANRVLLATLSIPLPSAHLEFDRFIETDKSPQEKAQKLAILLGLPQPPTRKSLLKDVVRLNVVNLASPQFRDLYSWLEVQFHPLELCSRVDSVIKTLKLDESSPLLQYIPALQNVTLVRLIHQISQVYQTIEFSRLVQLSTFTTAFHFRRLLVDCVRYNDMQIRIDHAKECVKFGINLSEAQREDHPDGSVLQVMPSEQIRCQLINMATVLHRAIGVTNSDKKKQDRDKLRATMVNHYHGTKLDEHRMILERHSIIEKRKEYIERINTVREEEEMRRQEELQRLTMLAEQKRLELEREERERRRQQSEIQQIKDRHLKEKMQQISLTSHGQKVLKKLDGDGIKKLDAEQIAVREFEELQKERREMQQKLKSQEKRVDFLERAKRLEEIPLLEKAMEEKSELAKQLWEQQEAERIQVAIEERQQAVATRERLSRMKEDCNIFLSGIVAERKSVYLEKLDDFEKILSEEKLKRLASRKLQRKLERKTQWEKERIEAAERKKQEEMRKEQEEERRRLEEERMKKEEEERIRRAEEQVKEAERLAKLERQAEITRAKEAEIEKKLEEERKRSQQESPWRSRGQITDKDRQYAPHRPNVAEEVSSWRSGGDPKEREDGKKLTWRRDNYDNDRMKRRDYDENDKWRLPRDYGRVDRKDNRKDDRRDDRKEESRDDRCDDRRDDRRDIRRDVRGFGNLDMRRDANRDGVMRYDREDRDRKQQFSNWRQEKESQGIKDRLKDRTEDRIDEKMSRRELKKENRPPEDEESGWSKVGKR